MAPYGDDDYHRARPTLGLRAPTDRRVGRARRVAQGTFVNTLRTVLTDHPLVQRCLHVQELLALASERGVDRIAITDHNRLYVALEMAERHPDRIIPGEEVKTAEGIDVIGLYLSEEIPKGTPAEDTIERIRGALNPGLVYDLTDDEIEEDGDEDEEESDLEERAESSGNVEMESPSSQ